MRLVLVFAAWLIVASACSSSDCTVSAPSCSADGHRAIRCEGGKDVETDCFGGGAGRLCEAGACVIASSVGAPAYPSCSDDPHAVGPSLHEKAAHYDEVAVRLNVNPSLGWALGLTLQGRTSSCAPGATPPCVSPRIPEIPEATATMSNVVAWHSGENDGLWSALYLTSQAYRYGATRDPAALQMIKLLLAGEVKRMRISGVPGIFTRQLIPPNVPGLSCPTDLHVYAVDPEKDDNMWVRIGDDGCAEVYDPALQAMKKTDHCGLMDFAGWCWLDNVSKDEYAGHMLALAALLQLVDDSEVQATVKDLLGQVGRHLVEHQLVLIDWDGRPTEHGHFSPAAFDDYPAFNAAMGLAYLETAAVATQDPAILAFRDKCLLQKDGGMPCLGLDAPESFLVQLTTPNAAGLYVGPEACGSNYNNISMHMLSLLTLLLVEPDPGIRAIAQGHLRKEAFLADQPRALSKQHNPMFDFIYAALKELGPGSDGPALDAVKDGVCQLRQFRPTNEEVDIRLEPDQVPYCKNRFDEDVGEHPRQAYQRCSATFAWWSDPYDLDTCTANARSIGPPAGYLLPYWMGRYYGLIAPEL
ncbi:MAG: hypothetical protein U1E65_07770 [Myxococcota bacterium]